MILLIVLLSLWAIAAPFAGVMAGVRLGRGRGAHRAGRRATLPGYPGPGQLMMPPLAGVPVLPAAPAWPDPAAERRASWEGDDTPWQLP